MKLNFIYIVSFLFVFIAFVIYLLLKNSFLCSNFYFIETVLPSLCQDISNSSNLLLAANLQLEELCFYLCVTPLEFSCHTYHLSKPFVFTVSEKDHQKKFVLKAVIEDNEDEEAYWKQKNDKPYIPTTEELEGMVVSHVSLFLGTSNYSSLNQIDSSSYLSSVSDLSLHEEFWKLIYDHEFLTAYLFKHHKLFPTVKGICKQFYAVDYVKPLTENPLLSLDITWKMRIKKAIDLLYFIEKLKSSWVEPIHLCDTKHDHFGWTEGKEEHVLYLDLDSVLTESSLKNIMTNVPECSTDEDCSYFDCVGECLPNRQCSGKRRNTNLQVLCYKIFLGNSDTSIMGLYGLLNSYKGSDTLKEALDLCSTNPGMTADVLIQTLQEEYTLSEED